MAIPTAFFRLALIFAALFAAAPISTAAESPAEHDQRMAWWREARFGMFIHWGLYSQLAGSWDGKPTSGAGEWIMNDKKIPLSQYAKLVPQFNPVKFNADEWVRAARGAGMKYIVITSKHHEGFGMFRSSLTDWCIKSTPFQRDPLKELSAACQKEGVKLCFYYSIMDWHHPDYAPRKSWDDIDTAPPDFDRYIAFMKGELKELLTGYGPIGILWFDGEWENTWTPDRGEDLYNYIRSLQPNIIVNNRVGKARAGMSGMNTGSDRVGDYGTPEQEIPAKGFGPGVDWESCMTMNDTWGFKKQDQDWKSTQTLVRNLIDCASKGGNYLLNVGPTGEGLIPGASLERLKEIGVWLDANGKAIYGTAAGPFSRQLPWGRCTSKISGDDTTLYLHVFKWPGDGNLLVPGLKNQITAAYLLTDSARRKLATKKGEDGVMVSLPANAPDKISSTVVLEFTGAPDIQSTPLVQLGDGSVLLPAIEARVHGSTLQYESNGQRDNLGFWTNPNDWADWEFTVSKPGKFAVSAEVAGLAASSFELSAAGQTLHCAAPDTGDYGKFKRVELGTVEIPAAGSAVVAVRPVKNGWQPVNLKAIRLKPVSP